MASIVQFVDSIASSPGVRCDLNSTAAGLMVDVPGMNLSPPPLRRTVVSTMMTDGEIIPAAAYGNRTLTIPVKLHGVSTVSTDAAATALQNLAHELVRPTNILKVQLDGATSPTFFQTFAAPDYVISMLRLQLTMNTTVELTIPATPFGLGLEEILSPVTVTEDPAAGTNGMFWDISGVKGDVETPAILVLPTGNLYDAEDPISVLSIRRRGTVSAVPFVLQAETGTSMGTDTSVIGSDTAMSNSSYARTTFSTNSSMVRRVYLDPFPTSASINNRGTYRVIMCGRRSSGTGSINVQLGYTSGTAGILVQNDAVPVPGVAVRQHVDLGLITYPTGLDPVTYGYSNVEVPVRGRYLEVRAERTSGSASLDFDYLLFVPADDNLALIDWGDAILNTNEFVVDGVHEIVYTQNTPQDQVYGSKATAVAGGFPTISPDTTNRMFFIRRTGRGATVTKTETTSIEVRYYPRYLVVRPATT